MSAQPPPVNVQGKAVVELAIPGPGVMVMLPDGEVFYRRTKKAALSRIKAWFALRGQVDALNLGLIEWRGVEPPMGAA